MTKTVAATLASASIWLAAFADGLDGPLRSIAMDLSNRELAVKEAAIAAGIMSPESMVGESLAFMMAGSDAASEAASVRFLLALDKFPFDEVAMRFKASTTSVERAYTLHLLNLGVRNQANSNVVCELAASVLHDTGAGLRRYGEARAHSADGKRVCDVAYNILVSRRGLEATLPILDVDNHPPLKRDQLIKQLGSTLKLPGPPSRGATPQTTLGAGTPVIGESRSESSQVKPALKTLTDKAASTTPWRMIVVLVGVSGVLLWMLRKRRS